jgi:hypothetical protein
MLSGSQKIFNVIYLNGYLYNVLKEYLWVFSVNYLQTQDTLM